MADDPNKREVDGRFLSWQAHEIAYARRRLQKLYPAKSAREIAETVAAVKWMMGASEGRKRFMNLCAIILRNT